jgi:uncharacterized protein (DUF305 family)
MLSACGNDADHDMGSMSSAMPTSSAPTTAGSSSGGATTSTERNDADVMFTQMMIEHHRGAIDMAKLATTRAASPDVKALAAKIEAAQQPEIDLMTSWLTAWGVTDQEPGGHGNHGAGAMPGMMSEEQMTDLEKASGAEFDRMFLELMTEHHEGAIDMAKKEQVDGKNPEAVALAKKIIADQTAEITEMKSMLQAL